MGWDVYYYYVHTQLHGLRSFFLRQVTTSVACYARPFPPRCLITIKRRTNQVTTVGPLWWTIRALVWPLAKLLGKHFKSHVLQDCVAMHTLPPQIKLSLLQTSASIATPGR